jgi:hypothetical protein
MMISLLTETHTSALPAGLFDRVTRRFRQQLRHLGASVAVVLSNLVARLLTSIVRTTAIGMIVIICVRFQWCTDDLFVQYSEAVSQVDLRLGQSHSLT